MTVILNFGYPLLVCNLVDFFNSGGGPKSFNLSSFHSYSACVRSSNLSSHRFSLMLSSFCWIFYSCVASRVGCCEFFEDILHITRDYLTGVGGYLNYWTFLKVSSLTKF